MLGDGGGLFINVELLIAVVHKESGDSLFLSIFEFHIPN